MATWDDSEKFKYETTRTIIIALLGFLATIWLVKPWEKRIEYQAELDKERMQIRRTVVDDFLRSSYLYTSVSYDVLNKEPDANVAEWKGALYDRYRNDLNRINVYFREEHSDLPSRANTLCRDLKDHYDGNSKSCDWRKCLEALKDVNNEIASKALGDLKLITFSQMRQ